jgi:hypothetical protein
MKRTWNARLTRTFSVNLIGDLIPDYIILYTRFLKPIRIVIIVPLLYSILVNFIRHGVHMHITTLVYVTIFRSHLG